MAVNAYAPDGRAQQWAARTALAAAAFAVLLPLFTTNPDDFKGLDDLLSVVPVTRPKVLHDR